MQALRDMARFPFWPKCVVHCTAGDGVIYLCVCGCGGCCLNQVNQDSPHVLTDVSKVITSASFNHWASKVWSERWWLALDCATAGCLLAVLKNRYQSTDSQVMSDALHTLSRSDPFHNLPATANSELNRQKQA